MLGPEFVVLRVILTLVVFIGFIVFLCYLESGRICRLTPQKQREYFEKTRRSDHQMLAKMYAEECKDRDLSKFDARNMVEHYLEWNLNAQPGVGLFTEPGDRPAAHERYRQTMARQVVDLVYGIQRTAENTKPHITVRADLG